MRYGGSLIVAWYRPLERRRFTATWRGAAIMALKALGLPGMIVLVLAAASNVSQAAEGRPPAETVLLLHGLSRTPRSMKRLELAIAKAGYQVLNIGYPSNSYPIEQLADMLHSTFSVWCPAPGHRVHFVTQSMGGIVARYYLGTRPCPNLGRVVMLAPPNGGSELVDYLRKVPLLGRGGAPARRQLGTGPSDLPPRLGAVHYELGIIAGNRSLNLVLSLLIPGPDDSRVSVERAKAPGMKDFLVVAHSHTVITTKKDVIAQTLRFLREGTFDHAGPVRESS